MAKEKNTILVSELAGQALSFDFGETSLCFANTIKGKASESADGGAGLLSFELSSGASFKAGFNHTFWLGEIDLTRANRKVPVYCSLHFLITLSSISQIFVELLWRNLLFRLHNPFLLIFFFCGVRLR